MAEYTIRDPKSGKTITVRGDAPPSEQELEQIFAHVNQSEPTAPVAKPEGQRVEGGSFAEKIGNAAKAIGTALPAAGGIVGGAIAGVPGALIGGATGQGYKELFQHASELPGAVADVARNVVEHPVATAEGFVGGTNQGGLDVTKQGVGQGVGQAAGEALVSKAVSPMATWLMNRATTRVSTKLMQEFPELSDTLISNALTVSKGGYGRARALLATAKGKATAALKSADASGAEVPVVLNEDLAQSLKTALLEKSIKGGTIGKAGSGPLTVATERLDAPTKALFQQIDAATNGGTMKLTPSQADLLKTQLQKESRALYANRTAPNGPKAMGMDATERAEFASRLNDMIEGVASGYKAANAEAKPLIGAVRGIAQAIRPNGNLYQAMVRPAVGAMIGEETSRNTGMNPIVGGVLGAAATSPAGMSREALILAHPATAHLLRALPKPLAQFLVGVLSTDQSAEAATPAGKQ